LLCKQRDLDEIDFITIFRKSRRVAPGRADATRADVNAILDLYRSFESEDAQKVVEMWNRDREYLSAIRKLLPETP